MLHLLQMKVILYPWLILLLTIPYLVLMNQSYRYTYLNIFSHLPTLLHEFGHALFCQLTDGNVRDIVIVTSTTERNTTHRAGYTITETRGSFNQFFTMIGGYLFPPLMLLFSIAAAEQNVPSLFWMIFLVIFIYYLIKTSRKLMPLLILIISSAIIYLSQALHISIAINDVYSFMYHTVISILLADTLIATLTITQVYFKDKNNEWDGAQLSRLTHLPTFFYYLLFTAVHLTALYYSLRLIV